MSSAVSLFNSFLTNFELLFKEDQEQVIHKDALILTFSFLNKAELGRVASVSKKWQTYTNNPKLWVTESNSNRTKRDFLNKLNVEKQKISLLKEKSLKLPPFITSLAVATMFCLTPGTLVVKSLLKGTSALIQSVWEQSIQTEEFKKSVLTFGIVLGYGAVLYKLIQKKMIPLQLVEDCQASLRIMQTIKKIESDIIKLLIEEPTALKKDSKDSKDSK